GGKDTEDLIAGLVNSSIASYVEGHGVRCRRQVMKHVMKARFVAILLLSLPVIPAVAQVYNPAAPGVPPPILPATPPQAQPHMQPIPPLIGESSRTNQ